MKKNFVNRYFVTVLDKFKVSLCTKTKENWDKEILKTYLKK